jgi:hypothetical protein
MKLGLVLLVLVGGLRADPFFVGTISTSESGVYYLLADGEGSQPRWLKIGQRFGDYSLDYLPKDEALILKKEGRMVSLRLRSAKIPSLKAIVSEADLLAIAKREVAKQDGWDASATYQPAQRYREFWFVVATRSLVKKNEGRLIILTDEGIVKHYARTK